ncbi:LIM and calponin homology domains-containing protein 1 isoform X2 [Pleurodeles waltl]|uniref:LIM and calponin homology domains-containing protein 1 isoform X2 n=1 Tax=Pleurodeles waltl TaxID=8319 RepID=UPI003709A6EC
MGGWQSPFHPPCLFLAARWWRGLGSHSCGSVGAAAAERRVAAERSRGARPGRGYRCQLRSPCARAVRSRLPPAQSGSERMASPGLDLAGVPPLQESAPEAAFSEAQKWIEQVTGRCFGDKDFRSGLENGILLCELLNAIRPGLVKKINRLPTPIAGLDNISLFLRGCKELGLKESQLFDPGDLQDTSNRAALKNTDYSRKLKNVLVTIYWLGKAANSCTSYSGATLDLKEFEGLLAQMRKETDDIDSPKRSIRDSGYIDCWDSERSDSLSPPRHGRDDSFDSLDSFGSRSQQTPSPDVVLRGSSDGRGSDSESDFPHRKIPDVKKDDMSARRISYGENKAFVPFNQYLPNKSNQTAYIPAPLRKKKAEREEYRKSWSTATSPLGGERPFSQSHPEQIKEEKFEVLSDGKFNEPIKEDSLTRPGGKPPSIQADMNPYPVVSKDQTVTEGQKEVSADKLGQDDSEELRKLKKLERIGIRVMPAAKRYSSPNQTSEDHGTKPGTPDIILRKENTFLVGYHGKGSDSEEDNDECRVPDIQKDDLATRRIRMSQIKPTPVSQLPLGLYAVQKGNKREDLRLPAQEHSGTSPALTSQKQGRLEEGNQILTRKENPFLSLCENESEEEEEPEKIPDVQRDDLAKRKTQGSSSQPREPPSFVNVSITKADLETWERLKVSAETSDDESRLPLHKDKSDSKATEEVPVSVEDDLACRKARESRKRGHPRQRFVHFGPVTEIDQQKWEKLSIAKPEAVGEAAVEKSSSQACAAAASTSPACAPITCTKELEEEVLHPDPSSSVPMPAAAAHCHIAGSPSSTSSAFLKEESSQVLKVESQRHIETEDGTRTPDREKDDMRMRRTGAVQKLSSPGLRHFLPVPFTRKKEDLTVGPTKIDKPVRSTTKPPLCTLDEHVQTLLPVRAECLPKVATQPQPTDVADGDQHLETTEDAEHDHRPLVSPPKYPALNQIVPGQAAEEEPETFSPRIALSDDTESVSMFDVRCDDAAVTQPHSRVHQEQLQNVNNLLKEEDDQWQDDLARWKTRRRSVSQDLIKKEEERKKMEKVLSGEDALSERRKSIKTYREIVEEKERREKELHEAYKNAKSQEEAEKILQKYIERFTISEAVLESLQMPKILERRHSVEPNKRSPPEDPNPMKYLRQHSLPVTAPKFTATVEASISPTSETEAKFSTGRTSPTKTAMSKAVPLLVPKPYSQPKTTHALKTFKVDGKVNMNGEAFNGIEDENESRCASVVFAPSASRSQMFEGVARIDEPQEQLKPEATTIELNLRKPVSRTVYKEVTASPTEERIQANQKEDKNSGGCTERRDSGHVPPEVTDPERTQQTTINSSNTGTTSMEHKSTDVCKEVAEKEKVVKCVARDTPKEVLFKKKAVKSETNELEEYAVFEFFKKPSKATHPPCQNTSEQVDSSSGEKSPVLVPTLNLTKRVNFWTWDPEEERKRQERWQQEQERLLQERYQKEQEKLKDEWEKAQKEVEEEERKYLEEERKIIEDTVVPFTISSSSAEPFSSCSSSSVTENNMGPLSLVRPVGEQKNHHEVAEQQTCAAPIGTEHVEEKQPTAVNEKQNSVWDHNGDSLLSNGKGDLWLENKSRKEVSEPCPETLLPIRSEERSQTRAEECSSPARMQLHLQGAPKTSQHFLQEPPVSEEHGLKASSLGSSLQVHTSGGIRRNESHENIRAGQSSPCSPTPQCHSPGRAVSGKKLCSTCGLPLGKGAAMIIETLSLYFHIQCFQCGICKGQLGDTTSGTDVRIRNGLLNCNDCYIRSRTAGQPTTL